MNSLDHFWHVTRAAGIFIFTRANDREWIQALTFLAIGFILIWLSGYVLKIILARWFGNISRDLTKKILLAAQGPVRLLIFIYFSVLAFDSFKDMPPLLWQRIHTEFYPLINTVIIFVFAYRIVDIVSQILRVRWASETTSLDERWADLLGYVGKGTVVLAGLLTLLSNFGVNIVPFLTGAGFFGAALALASQHTIANAIGSLEIMLDRLFKEGDRISFGEYDGFVTKMGLRSIQLTALSGEKINLPNKDLVDKQIRNYSRNKLVRTSLSVGIAYECKRPKIEKAMKLLEEIGQNHSRIKDAECSFRKLGEKSLDLNLSFWANYKNSSEYYELISALHLDIKEQFDKAGIDFSVPTPTVVVKNSEIEA